MNAETFNSLYPVGTPVVVYPGARPEDVPSTRRLVTRTRSEAQPFGLDREGVVWVHGHGACIALTHVDVVTDAEPITDLATAVEVMGALPMPAGPAAPKTLTPSREQQIRALEPAPPGLLGLGQAGSESERRLYGRAVELHAACGELLAEIGRLRGEQRQTRSRVAELEHPAELKRRNEVRSSYVALISQAEQDGDYEGAATLSLQLRACESMWQRTDEEAGR